MAILHPTPVSSRAFLVIHDERGAILCADISDFGPEFRMGQVYDDACDAGITVVSERTGKSVVFGIEHTERDRENDVLWWDLEPADLRERTGVRVRLFND
jgi:hypothetical protein